MHTFDQALGRLAEDTGWLPLVVVEDRASRGIRSRGADARQPHGLRIGERHVAAGVREQDRVLRSDPAEFRVERIALDIRLGPGRPLLLMPATSNDPLPRRRCFAASSTWRTMSSHVFAWRRIEHHARFAQGDEMAMPFDKTRHGKPAGEIDDLCLRAHELAHRLTGSNGDDPIAPHRQGLDQGIALVQRNDLAVTQHQIGRHSSMVGRTDQGNARAVRRSGVRRNGFMVWSSSAKTACPAEVLWDVRKGRQDGAQGVDFVRRSRRMAAEAAPARAAFPPASRHPLALIQRLSEPCLAILSFIGAPPFLLLYRSFRHFPPRLCSPDFVVNS